MPVLEHELLNLLRLTALLVLKFLLERCYFTLADAGQRSDTLRLAQQSTTCLFPKGPHNSALWSFPQCP